MKINSLIKLKKYIDDNRCYFVNWKPEEMANETIVEYSEGNCGDVGGMVGRRGGKRGDKRGGGGSNWNDRRIFRM